MHVSDLKETPTSMHETRADERIDWVRGGAFHSHSSRLSIGVLDGRQLRSGVYLRAPLAGSNVRSHGRLSPLFLASNLQDHQMVLFPARLDWRIGNSEGAVVVGGKSSGPSRHFRHRASFLHRE